MPIKPQELEKLLTIKFGFSLAVERSPDHRWYELRLAGIPLIATKVSHSKTEIGATLEAKIARQLRVRHPYFRGMVDCTNSRQDYYRQVHEEPFPPWDIRF
jgi:hypothetical protein